MTNITIKQYTVNDLETLTEMFKTYFRDDFEMKISDEGAKKMCRQISDDILNGIVDLDLLKHDDKTIGFINYQIDSKRSDWCEREGWGFIRELYIKKNHRGKKFASALVKHAIDTFKEAGVKDIYLTSDDMKEFWLSCGFQATDKISNLNKDPIFEMKHIV